MKTLLTLLALTTTLSFAARAPFLPEVDARFNKLDGSSVSVSGLYGMRLAVAVVDFSDIAAQSNATININVPDNAVVLNAYYEVITTFTSSTDAATIGLQLEGASDLVAAIAISDVSNPWDAAGLVQLAPDYATPADAVKTTQERDLTVVRAGGEDLTAGKMRVYLQYVLSE